MKFELNNLANIVVIRMINSSLSIVKNVSSCNMSQLSYTLDLSISSPPPPSYHDMITVKLIPV